MNKTRLFCVAHLFLVGTCLFAEGEPAKEAEKDIPYTVAEEWKIGSSGSGAAIVIDPKNRNEKDMKALGEILRKKHLQNERAHIYIFDNAKAAKMRKQVPEKGAEAKLYEKHLIGFYVKNSMTKQHLCWFGITAKGVQGKTTEIKYDIP